MDDRINKLLFDIKSSILEIESYFGNSKDFLAYKENIMLKRAVERNLEIIGEAMNRILKIDKGFEIKISDARDIVGLRNQVIHSYDNISDENIWAIVVNHLPQLKKEVENLMTAK